MAGAATPRFSGWRVQLFSLAEAVLLAAAAVGSAGIGLALLGFTFYGSRYAPALLGAWALGLVVALRLPLRGGPRVLVVAALQLALVLALNAWVRRGPDRDELPAEGDAYVAALGRHFEAYGRYPDSIEELGLTFRRNGFGGWKYASREGGRSYHLRCGEYDVDDFVLYRDAEDEVWQWDR